jgi:pimeloyl-ACP methyl ester carboxylesterase
MATFVLVHGAMHGGWCWRDVRHRLAAGGHDVVAPTLTGQGDRRATATPDVGVTTHVDDVAELVWFEDVRDVQLVLHSYAGVLAGPLVDRLGDRLAGIVYLGAFVTADGECLLDVEPPDVAERYRSLAATGGDGWRVPADPSFVAQWGLTDPALAGWVGARLTDFPVRCQTEPTVFDERRRAAVRQTYVRHTAPPMASLDVSYARAVAAGWDRHDIAAGHDMMLEAPDTVADLLVRIAG